MADIKDLVGLTLGLVQQVKDESINFETNDGRSFVMYHSQDCCEHVYVEDICGDLMDIVGSPILNAEEATYNDEYPPGTRQEEYVPESFTWTFYKIDTIKGGVTIRWYGSSNGYYSEVVDFEEIGGTL